MPIDDPTDLTGDFVVKSLLGKNCDDFRNILRKEKLEDLFRSNCFGYFLNLPEDNSVRFQMSIVYGLLKRRIKYAGDDKDLKEGTKRWMKYGLPTVVHPWLVPTEQEFRITSFMTLGLVHTIADSTVELVKKELAKVTTIRREVRQAQPHVEAFHDQPTTIDSGASYGGFGSDGGDGGVVDIGASHTDKHVVDAQ
ncbi:hypothetical protein FXO38_18568 [Capsicum annuum]|nr:hypothetical protein FXO38_18568 [Capsicum annuum]